MPGFRYATPGARHLRERLPVAKVLRNQTEMSTDPEIDIRLHLSSFARGKKRTWRCGQVLLHISGDRDLTERFGIHL